MPLELENVQSGYNLSVINENFQRIEDTWDEKLDRLESSQGNPMEQELDMNSNHIINHPAPRNDTDIARLKDIKDFLVVTGAQGVTPLVQARQTGDGVTTIFAAPNTKSVTPTSMIINIDGITQRAFTDYQVTGPHTVVFNEAPPINADVDITYFEPKIVGQGGATGSFLSQDGKTINVANGNIVSIV